MTITAISTTRIGNATRVEVTTDLAGSVWFHWYVDGVYAGVTTLPENTFYTDDGGQGRVDILDTEDEDFDPVANAPDRPPTRRTLWWVRSLDDDVAHYRVEQSQDGGDWSSLGIVPHVAGQWEYSLVTFRLDDLSNYQWRVVPVDVAGNDGTPAVLDAETIVRTPDAPAFSVSFDEGTSEVTFEAA